MTARRTTALALSLLLTGCSFFSRTKSRIYSLERIPPAAPVTAVRGVPIGIDSLEIPPGFDRSDVVVRLPNHQLDVRGIEQWSASLAPLVRHTLASDLAARLPEAMVILPGQAIPPGPMRAIDVAFEELAAGPENAVVLDAQWVVREEGRPTVRRHERITVDLRSLDSAEVAAGLSRALATFADRIAAQLGPG